MLDLAPFSNEHTVFWASSLFAGFTVMAILFSITGPFKKRPMLAAHHLAMVAPFAYLAYQGTLHWFTSSGAIPNTPSSRMFHVFDAAACFAPTMFGLQIFDLSTTILVPGMGKADAVAHHTVALLLAYQLTSTGFMQYWEPFYFGILELSSVPLCFVDLFRAFPAFAKRFDAINEIVRVAFAATFLPIRCIAMPWISYLWWTDFFTCVVRPAHACCLPVHSAAVRARLRIRLASADLLPFFLSRGSLGAPPRLRNDSASKMNANSALFIAFGAINVFLCVLQQYWGVKIVTAALKMAKGDKGGRDKEA